MHYLAPGHSTLFGLWNLPELSSHDWRQLRDDEIRTHHRAVLDRRMGNFLSCTGAGPALGVAVASGDTAAAHQVCLGRETRRMVSTRQHHTGPSAVLSLALLPTPLLAFTQQQGLTGWFCADTALTSRVILLPAKQARSNFGRSGSR